MVNRNKDIRELLHALEKVKHPPANERGWLLGKKLAERVKQLKPGELILVDYPGSNKRNIKYYLRRRHGVNVKAYYADGNKVLISPLRGAEA
ncbi:hypothetical protein HQ563_03345 [bacterium]|nr:hypothetical protein [bacterium]